MSEFHPEDTEYPKDLPSGSEGSRDYNMQISVINKQREVRLNIKKIEACARKILKILHVAPEASLGVTFLSSGKVRHLNKRYFKRDKVTDVIALGYRDNGERDIYKDYLGDIIICPRIALSNSKLYKSDFLSELALYIIHGILHLRGYTDAEKKEKTKMQKKERVLLSSLRRAGLI